MVDEDVAGYGVTMLDGPVHRLWDGRVADEWQRYRGGLVCDVTAVRRAIDTPGVSTFDWLRGRKPGALGACVGAVVGLVAVTPAAGFITVGQSIAVGRTCVSPSVSAESGAFCTAKLTWNSGFRVRSRSG